MKFFSILFSISLAVCSVSAVQNATATTAITTTSSVVSGTAPLTPAQSTEAACLEACPVGDNSCRSKCIPLADQTNGVADCISSCPKGNGTAADNASYQSCVEDCIRSGGTSTTASPEASETASGSESATAGSGSSASSGATGTGSGSGSASSTSTATGSAASASKTSAAEIVQFGASLIGAASLFAALLAL